MISSAKITPKNTLRPKSWNYDNFKAKTTQSILPDPESAKQHLRFSVLVAKYTLQDSTESDDDCFAGNEGHESDTDTSNNDSDIGGSDDEVYNWLPKASSFELVTWYGLL